MKIKLQQVGNPKFPRYILALENGCYFDGQRWTPSQTKAIRYASLPVVKKDWKKLQKEMESDLIELTGTYIVRITGVKELTAQQIEALAWYMSAASSLTLDYSHPRPAGLEQLVISSVVVWGSLQKKE